jgi:ribosomal protein S12 methylthiotransferase accessory factor
MEMTITFPGGQAVDADFNGLVVHTDQDGTAPSPFSLFLASLATCAGFYVLSFCQKRKLPVEQLKLVQKSTRDPETHRLTEVRLEIEAGPGIPEKYHEAMIRAAAQCAVKRALENPPQIVVLVNGKG